MCCNFHDSRMYENGVTVNQRTLLVYFFEKKLTLPEFCTFNWISFKFLEFALKMSNLPQARSHGEGGCTVPPKVGTGITGRNGTGNTEVPVLSP